MPSRSHRMHAMHGQTLRASAGAQCPTLKKWMKFTDRMTGNSTCVWHSDVEMTFAEAWVFISFLMLLFIRFRSKSAFLHKLSINKKYLLKSVKIQYYLNVIIIAILTIIAT